MAVTRSATASEAETMAIARELGARLQPGAVVLLSGPLGAGKTAFVRGLAEGLECDPAAVSSPTFTVVQEYTGRAVLQHVDLYRLTPAEVDDLALEDLMSGSVVAVEWPDRWRDPPEDAWWVSLELAGGDRRTIAITAPGAADDHSTR